MEPTIEDYQVLVGKVSAQRNMAMDQLAQMESLNEGLIKQLADLRDQGEEE